MKKHSHGDIATLATPLLREKSSKKKNINAILSAPGNYYINVFNDAPY